MRIYKEICEEIQVDVDLEDFDFKDICNFIVETAVDGSYYEQECIKDLQNSLFQGDLSMGDFVNGMDREYFEKLFELMKNSWQALV
jgi:hypothetical protein